MQTTFISLVMGSEGSGISALLQAFATRADLLNTEIIDQNRLIGAGIVPERFGADQAGIWLQQLRAEGVERRQADGDERLSPGTSRIILASHDLRAPRHILHALAADQALGAGFRLDGVTLVATADEAADIGAHQPLSRAAAMADRIVLTGTDAADPALVKRLAAELKALNPPAPILRARNGDIGPARLVDSGLFDPVTQSIDIDRWLCEAAFGFEAARRGGLNLPQSTLGGLRDDRGVRFFAITLDQPVSSTVLSVFLKLLMADRGADLLRLKGIIATLEHPDRPALIDGREHIIQPLLWLPNWPTADRRSRLVFATTDLSETWIRTLLTTLSDQLDPAHRPALQWATLDARAG